MTALAPARPSPPARRLAVLAAASVVAALALIAILLADRLLFDDYRATLWEAGRDVLAGRSPYPSPDQLGYPAVYPPAIILAVLPLAALPFWLAALAWGLLLTLAGAVLVRTLALTDRRLVVLVLASLPVVTGIWMGNVTLLVALAAAFTWRYRDRPAVLAAALTFGVVSKLLLWPLFGWLLLTRRFRAAALAAVATPVIVVASWAAIDFHGFAPYPALLRGLTRDYGDSSLSVYGLLANLGVGRAAALAASLLAGAIALACAGVALRRARSEACFALALIACFLVTPVSWTHNLALLIVAIAALAPAASAVWYVVPALWLVLPAAAAPGPLPAAVAIVLAALVAARALPIELGRTPAPKAAGAPSRA